MKCFRNNWLNSSYKIFKFPCLGDFFVENIDFLFQKRNLIDYKPELETGDWKFFNKTL